MRIDTAFSRIASLLLIGAIVACDDDPTDPDPVAISSIEIFLPDTVDVGENLVIQAVVLDEAGDTIHDPALDWHSDAPSVVDVDDDGELSALARGFATVTASAGGHTASAGTIVVERGSDPFDGSVLNGYTVAGGAAAWTVDAGSLTTTGIAMHSVALRAGLEFEDGWIEADMDMADDGGLVLRYVDSGNYYLLAIRDDDTNTPRDHGNVQLYKRVDGVFHELDEEGIVVSWPRGEVRTVRLEVEGTTLRSYVDDMLVSTAVDATFDSGLAGMRHHAEYGTASVVRYQELRWLASP